MTSAIWRMRGCHQKKASTRAILDGSKRNQLSNKGSNRRTFFSLSIHLLMAIVEEPVRSFKARIASLINAIVVMVANSSFNERNFFEPFYKTHPFLSSQSRDEQKTCPPALRFLSFTSYFLLIQKVLSNSNCDINPIISQMSRSRASTISNALPLLARYFCATKDSSVCRPKRVSTTRRFFVSSSRRQQCGKSKRRALGLSLLAPWTPLSPPSSRLLLVAISF